LGASQRWLLAMNREKKRKAEAKDRGEEPEFSL
jgi:hypothetical protein